MNITVSTTKCKILGKKGTFSVKSKQKGKYVKKAVFSLIIFLNKATYNSFIHDKGTGN